MTTPPDDHDTPVVPPPTEAFDEEDPTKPSIRFATDKFPCPVCNGMRVVASTGVNEKGEIATRDIPCGACRGSGERPVTRVETPPDSGPEAA